MAVFQPKLIIIMMLCLLDITHCNEDDSEQQQITVTTLSGIGQLGDMYDMSRNRPLTGMYVFNHISIKDLGHWLGYIGIMGHLQLSTYLL